METKLGWSPYQGFSLISFFADSISYLQVLYVFPQLAVEGMAAEGGAVLPRLMSVASILRM